MRTGTLSKLALRKAAQDRPEGYLDEVMSYVLSETDTHITISLRNYRKLKRKYSPPELVGTELRKLIEWFPIPKKGKCSCKSLERKMNQWGCDKCEQKMDYILKKLAINAKRKRVPFIKIVVKNRVRKAISNARKNKNNPTN